MNELGLVPTNELVAELKKRFDAIVVIGIQGNFKPNLDNYYDSYSGGHAACIGLCEIMRDRLMRDLLKSLDQ